MGLKGRGGGYRFIVDEVAEWDAAVAGKFARLSDAASLPRQQFRGSFEKPGPKGYGVWSGIPLTGECNEIHGEILNAK